VETVLIKSKYKPCQNHVQMRDLSESMERISKEKLLKIRPPIKVTPEKIT
jgi:hypothetical protein